MSLLKKTTVWVQEQIITREQKEKILAFENKKSNVTFWNTAFIIAGSLIGLGICLLVAANWDDIPEIIKIIGDFILLASFTYATYKSIITKHNGLKELFTVLSFAAIGATIGLLAQIFHLQGNWNNFAITWALLGLPFVIFNSFLFCNVAWLILLFTSFNWFEEFFRYINDLTALAILPLIMALYLVHILMQKLYAKLKNKITLIYATEKSLIWYIYCLIFIVAIAHGCGKTNLKAMEAYILVFGFFAFRMYLAIKGQNILSFKRNSILAETYIFIIFMSKMDNLWNSGLGFIAAGLLVLLFIWILRKTTRYIKQMEVFK